MPETSSSPRPSTTQLILVPSIITLALTILRLVGELQHWPGPWFSTTAGGGLAIIGISWLPLIFGPYFAFKLAGKGEGPASSGKSIAFPVLGLVILIAGGYVSFSGARAQSPSTVILGFVIVTAAGALCFPGWGALSKALLAYGLAARIPVANCDVLRAPRQLGNALRRSSSGLQWADGPLAKVSHDWHYPSDALLGTVYHCCRVASRSDREGHCAAG